jgi:butyrate kinase
MNLGTTSTRVTIYHDDTLFAENYLYHPDSERDSMSQEGHAKKRSQMLINWFDEVGFDPRDLDAISLRMGPLGIKNPGGVYAVEGSLLETFKRKYSPEDALYSGNSLCIPITDAIINGRAIPRYVVDPADQNDMIPEARISGLPEIERDTVFHALNHKMVARLEAEKLGKKYEDSNFVIAHLGGGISVAAHHKGRVIDTNNCSGSEGAFSGNRSGNLPTHQLIALCYSGKYSAQEMHLYVAKKAGVLAYLGTSDMREVEKRMNEGDEQAELLFSTVAYRTAKEIGALFVAMEDEVDAIILTGGMSNSKAMTRKISSYVERLAPVSIYEGERESEALALGALRVLRGEEKLVVLP